MDPDQTAPVDQTTHTGVELGPHCLPMRLQILKWMTKTNDVFLNYAL